MPTLNPTRLTAQVAPYLEAIAQARKAGFTWHDITRALGVQAAPAALRQAVKRCRYEAEQMPLPEPQATARPSTAQPAPQATPAAAPASTIKRLNI